MAPLPPGIQQTVQEVQRHYESYQEQIAQLHRENRDLKRKLEDYVANALLEEGKFKGKADLPGIIDTNDYDVESITLGTPSPPAVKNQNLMRDFEADSRKPSSSRPASKEEPDELEERPRRLTIRKFDMLKNDPFSDLEDVKESKLPKISKGCLVSSFYDHDTEGNELAKLTNALFFKTLSIAAIGANTIYLAVAADFNVKNSYRRLQGLEQEEHWIIPDIIFTSWFIIEVLMKMGADGIDFFKGEDQGWNLFDIALVSESLFSVITTLLYWPNGLGVGLSFLRIFRVFRLVRVVKVVRSVPALARLRTMIFAILNSFVDLLWAFLVVILILLVFGIIFASPVGSFFDAVDITDASQLAEAADMQVLFGDMLESMISLWSAVSGGNDWMTYGEQIRKLPNGALYFAIFNFYIAFCVVGLFNVVTGVFVDSAVCCRTADEVVQGYIEDLKNTTSEIKSFFKNADSDGSGTLSLSEFQHHMKDPAVKAYFSGLDIDPEEADTIFTILDADQNCELVIDELVNGTMKLKGAATKLDLMTLMYDLTDTHSRSEKMWAAMQSQLHDIRRRLPQARTDAHGKDLPRAVAIARRL
eukprot:CAMPEP_0197658806 /NCGR_PEP_ID=MMETSP1338-20131121/45457_1 /TAXON_ID=43686 ORGANISM="Pelagodinium beii, Strain RCC1491" /NCGR_SAMPLE_ID=MMETSP1338 /ASSEMBLY_ACC=CAM_ASM_000754 /LENGTH=587 /DNA_ID=CAMNT_0043235461 /DNA_START=49 /DNA_END=1812 /DNA_ORIENTATION=+